MQKKERKNLRMREERGHAFLTLKILGHLAEGVPPSAVLEKINEEELKGERNELRAKKIIERLRCVFSVVRVPRNSDQDVFNHTDLKVNLQGRGVRSLKIQVKSSYPAIENFRSNIMSKYDLASLEEYKQWLIEQRMIVLKVNDTLSDSVIADDFLTQLSKIESGYGLTNLKVE